MTRWYWKRWACGVVAAVAVGGWAVGVDKPAPPGPAPAAGTMILKSPDKPDQTVTVVKATRRPDGSVETLVKDVKTGETFTMLDGPAAAKAVDAPGGVVPAGKDGTPPKARPRGDDPLTPRSSTPMPVMPVEKKLFAGKLFTRDKADAPAATRVPPVTSPTAPVVADATPDGGRKFGIVNRIFGPKSADRPAAALPPATVPPAAGYTPPVVRPMPTPPAASAEPPRVMPPRPPATLSVPGRVEAVVPPTPVVPAPVAFPTATPPVPVPMTAPVVVPTPLPMTAPVVVPTPLPMTAPPVPVPTIPLPTGGLPRSAAPVVTGGVVPAAATTPRVAFADDLRPFDADLHDAPTVTARVIAAKGLAEGRHGSTDHVKGLLFEAAKTDPVGAVRAKCIDHLCRLGFYDPAFILFVGRACGDPDPEVRAAARATILKLTPKQW